MTDNYAWCLNHLNKDKIDIIAEIGSRDGLDSNFKLILEAYKYNFLSEKKYIPDINILFVNKILS